MAWHEAHRAGVAELADAGDLKSPGPSRGHVGSSPTSGTIARRPSSGRVRCAMALRVDLEQLRRQGDQSVELTENPEELDLIDDSWTFEGPITGS